MVAEGEAGKAHHILVSSMKTRTPTIVIAGGALWLLAIGIGLWMLWNYQNSAGAAGVPPPRWPVNSRVEPVAGQATLVIMAHPHCPCSRASIGELALVMARCQGRVSAYVLFFKPPDFPEGWERTDLWDSAGRIPGVTVLSDEGGIEASRFNAVTSGTAMLYNAEGRLLFSGGITGSRGHSGENEGRSAIVALVTGEAATRAETPVFGCSLVDENDACGKGEELCGK